MNPNVVRRLVQSKSDSEIKGAIAALEKRGALPFDVEGKDDGERLSHLLVAEFVQEKMKSGLGLNEALREYANRVKAMMSRPVGKTGV